MSVPTFVDLQGYTVGRTFIVKEVAILKNGSVLSHYIFASPMSWHLLSNADKSRAVWLMANHHGLRWGDGSIPYERAKHLITTAVVDETSEKPTLVYVKGLEKRNWLANLLDASDTLLIETMDAEYEEMASLDTLPTYNTMMRCNMHTRHCALQNVLKIFSWWSQQQKNVNSLSIYQ